MIMVLTLVTLGIQWFGFIYELYLRFVHKERERERDVSISFSTQL